MTATPYSLCFKSHLSPLLEAHIQTILFSNALREHRGEREGEGGRVRVNKWEGWRKSVGETELPSHIRYAGNAAFRCFNQSQSQNSQVLVSCLARLTLFYVCPQVAGYVLWMMISSLLHFDVSSSSSPPYPFPLCLCPEC